MLQGGTDKEALELWIMASKFLEFDNKARRDLFLLAISGEVGRTYANKILWNIMTGPAVCKEYLDLSNLVTHEVYKARKQFDRPPRGHPDMDWWLWTWYDYNHKQDLMFSPTAVPNVTWRLVTGPGGKPLPPTQCFGV